MKAISLLSCYCDFRRSEIVTLTWNQVNLAENYVQLYDVKSGQPRKVYILNKRSKKIIDNMPKTNGERLFSYDVLGFSGSFDKLIENLGLRKKAFDFIFLEEKLYQI